MLIDVTLQNPLLALFDALRPFL